MARQIFTFDPELGMTLIPGIRARKQHEDGGYLISSNRDGFRDDEFIVERAPGTRRILIYGDSFAFGAGVAKDERFGELIERSIPNVEVCNLGIVGSGVDQQYLSHKSVGSKLDHDLILVAPWVEDAKRNLQRYKLWNRKGKREESGLIWMSKPYFEVDESGELELHNFPVPPPKPYESFNDFESTQTGLGGRFDAIRWRLRKYHPRAKDVIQRLIRYQPARLYESTDNPGWILNRAILERWAGEAIAPGLICPIPMYQHIEGDASAKEVSARYRELHRPEAGVRYFDALPALKQGSRRKRRGYRFSSDIHFTAAGHRAFADAVVAEVGRMLDTADAVPVGSRP